MRPLPVPIERLRLLPLLGDVPENVFDATFTAACEELDAFVGQCLAFLYHRLELAGFVGTPEELARKRGFAPCGATLLRWVLETMAAYGLAEVTDGVFRTKAPCPEVDLEAEYQARVARLAAAAPALSVQKLATVSLPAVLAGQTTGEEALFSLATLELWFAYFANSNVHYAATNALAATALARAVPPGAAILEVGGGGGSAAEAAFARLLQADKPPRQYVFTEVHPAFLRRGSRLVRQQAPPGCQVEQGAYDINLPPEAQGFPLGFFDAVFGVNVFHLAKDLVAALRGVAQLLRPGGVLVLGELVRPGPDVPVHLELPFLLLESYRQAGGGDQLRPRPGFLALSSWQQALTQAGFAEIRLLPENLTRCLEIYPGFYCAALAATYPG